MTTPALLMLAQWVLQEDRRLHPLPASSARKVAGWRGRAVSTDASGGELTATRTTQRRSSDAADTLPDSRLREVCGYRDGPRALKVMRPNRAGQCLRRGAVQPVFGIDLMEPWLTGDWAEECSAFTFQRPIAPNWDLPPVVPSCALSKRLGGCTPAGYVSLPRCPTVPDHLAPIAADRDPAEPVVFYSMAGPVYNGAAACHGADAQDGIWTNCRPSNGAGFALPPMTFSLPLCRVARTRRPPRAERRWAMRHGRCRVRSDVGALRQDQPRTDGPPPGRLVSMSPCRSMAPPAQLVAPLSADALGRAA
jgi:hypothetical protein